MSVLPLLQGAAGRADAAVIFGWLTLPCLLFYGFIGDIGGGFAFALGALLLLPLFRTIPDGANVAIWPDARPVDAACALAAIVLTTLGGEGRLLPATADWAIRDAVLHDLIAEPWPFVYGIGGHAWLLRAPLGMYLMPAVIGKLGGLYAGYLALWLQNSLAIFTVLRIFCASAGAARSITVLVVICLFSGWDMVGALLATAGRMYAFHTHFRLPDDIGWWAGLFQYSSTVTLALWVPNHALAGWLVAAMLLLWDRGQIRIGALMIVAGLSMFWSPFALMGALPFLAKAGLEALWRRRIRMHDVVLPLLAAVMLTPIALYLTGDSAGVTRGFQPMSLSLAVRYTVFVAVEVVPFVVINQRFGAGYGGFSQSTYWVAVASLFLIPFYRLGFANDFAMRASIPALAVLAVTTGHTAYAVLQAGRPAPVIAVATVLGLGGLTGVDQVWHVLRAPNRGISTCDLIQAWDQDPASVGSKTTYLADPDHLAQSIRPGQPQVHAAGPGADRCLDQQL